MNEHGTGVFLGRRALLKQGSLLLAGVGLRGACPRNLFAADDAAPAIKFGVVTDLHHADKPAAGTRYYRETLGKLGEAADRFREEDPRFVVELGDFIDAADSVDVELRYLAEVNRAFAPIAERRHYVLGNHCVDTLTKEEFLGAIERPRSYYSFDEGGVHFVVLDSCFRADGKPYGRKNSKWTDANVPPDELEWLVADLQATHKPVVVFAHQRLDKAGVHSVRNAAEVRDALQKSGQVLAVLQGHSHANDYQDIAGIHYCTMAAVIEGSGPDNNGYSTVEVHGDGAIAVTGFRRQANYAWPVGQTGG